MVTNESNISPINAAFDKRGKIGVRNDTNNINDEFDIFGKFIAVQLRQMLLYDALACQYKMFNCNETKTTHGQP